MRDVTSRHFRDYADYLAHTSDQASTAPVFAPETEPVPEHAALTIEERARYDAGYRSGLADRRSFSERASAWDRGYVQGFQDVPAEPTPVSWVTPR